uniref:ATP synthase F0 subunit 8 n=1 Tax=Lophosia angusticauda TaxID=2906572 RepID=UPI0023D7FB0E|nr:ATP synthase F0 subunit 8 [Lophosia angusticauda]WDE75728.1 ATP synthase F0 subunit 8 [Lophosia angusticauda]
MPQMAPMNWLLMFFMFLLAFMIFNSLNYYTFPPLMPMSNNKLYPTQSTLNWKW